MSVRYLVAQLGARIHYAVPRILAKAGLLERFFTDSCAVKGWPRVLRLIPPGLRPVGIRRLLARVPEGLQPSQITAFNGFGRAYAQRRSRATTPTEQTATHLWAARRFCQLVLARGWGETSGIYCFNSAGLEILKRARDEGRKGVIEQTIAPKRVERELMEKENEHFTAWEPSAGRDGLADEFIQREEAEWQAADLVLCGSEFVRNGIARCGGPVEKCVVVPYGVEVPGARSQRSEVRERWSEIRGQKPESRKQPLRVVTVGAVGLRKGSPYVLDAAKRLKGCAQFRMVGSIGVTREAEARLREHVELIGAVPRSEVAAHFQWADVFLLPSLCEGSATVTYEAMACGLPVVCTPNTGSIVRDGTDGYIVPPGNADRIVERLSRFCEQPALLDAMSQQALERSTTCSLEAYGQRLVAALTQT